jgi:DNA-binding MarR family transcriptional regulator
VPDDPDWLTDRQQHVWRALLQLTTRLPARLNRALVADRGITLADIDVLVGLTDVPSGRVRVSELAHTLGWERSRLSHQVARMEASGLVRREACEDDARGTYVVVTGLGRSALGAAVPAHVALVRRLVVDAVDPDDLEHLGRVVDTILDRLAEYPEIPDPGHPDR